ncbi:MAG: hypothetical protein ACRDQA_03700 [Nocardioidaceae bacterium]
MYAVVRVNTWDDAKRAAAADDVAAFDRVHAEQPGFLGSLVVDLGEGRNAIVNLWKSEEHATAALPVVGPAVGRLLESLMTEQSQLVGTGEVIQGAELVHGAS